MLKLDGYQIFSQMYESANLLVYRGNWASFRQLEQEEKMLGIFNTDPNYRTLVETN
jgi:hypothetical protein